MAIQSEALNSTELLNSTESPNVTAIGNSTANTSKGVRATSWINIPGYSVQFDVPKHQVTHQHAQGWSEDQLQIESSNIPSGFVGTFSFSVYDTAGKQILRKANEISSLTGNIASGDMTNLQQLKTHVSDDCIIAFGFYDAGSGEEGLPNLSACWVTVTPYWGNWMDTIAPVGSEQAAKPFTSWVLPSAHDVGMNSLDNALAILNRDVFKVAAVMIAAIPFIGAAVLAVVGGLLQFKAGDIVTALAITQRDSVTDMMSLGARYFEFRPAHISGRLEPFSPLPDELYFTHWLIPGQSLSSWLDEVIGFLDKHPNEVAVVQIRFDGVDSSCKEGTNEEVADYVRQAIYRCGYCINVGDYADMSTSTIDQLRSQHKRLIVLPQSEDYSTYSDDAYATLDGQSILNVFPAFLREAPEKLDKCALALWQCQATATDIRGVAEYTAFVSNHLTSGLLATKPIVDKLTLPWLLQNVFPSMPSSRVQVVMNDWFDGATADVAIQLSTKYVNQKQVVGTGGNSASGRNGSDVAVLSGNRLNVSEFATS